MQSMKSLSPLKLVDSKLHCIKNTDITDNIVNEKDYNYIQNIYIYIIHDSDGMERNLGDLVMGQEICSDN